MRTITRCCLLTLPLALALACGTVTGTFDQSKTLRRSGHANLAEGMAIVAPPEISVSPLLHERLSDLVAAAIRNKAPDAKVVDSSQFLQALEAQKGYLEHFAKWKAVYVATGHPSAKPLPYYARASGVRYLLTLKSLAFHREDVNNAEATSLATCRAGCWVPQDGRTKRATLTLIGELIDTQSGKVVWKGQGKAIDQSWTTQADIGFLKFEAKDASADLQAENAVTVVARGLADALVSDPVSIALSR